ncbi:MAG: ROK family transcriptional regulator [Bacteroidota bacterium]
MKSQLRQKKDASYIYKLNKINVLNLIRESTEISRATIVKKTNLSAPTVTRIVASLIDDKFVTMVGEGDSTGGRPPKLVRFVGNHNFVIGVDVGSTSLRAGIANLHGDILTEIETPTMLTGGFDVIIQQVGRLINKLIDRSKLERHKILGVGLAVAGLINKGNGHVAYSPVFDWTNVDLEKELSKTIDFPIFHDNVSRVTALGELLYGIGKRYKNFISVNAGFGIGAGIIIDGDRYFGSKGFTGELGHIVLDRESRYVGKDGIKGCLEALSSGYGIAEIAKIRLTEESDTESLILSLVNGNIEDLSAKEVIDAAKMGDPLATEIFEDAMHFFAIGLDVLIKLFNPSAIVMSGGLTRSGTIFFEKLTEYLGLSSMLPVENKIELLPSSFQDDATLMGAFSLVISKVLMFENSVTPEKKLLEKLS